jgi:Flp pilus assembly protein TadD
VNISNAATTALSAKNYDKAIVYFQKLVDYKYQGGATWSKLADAHLAKGDSVKYRSTISEGLKLYPTDQNLLVADVNTKMAAGKNAEALDQLNALIAQRPDDPELNIIVGNVYDGLANPRNADGSDAPKPKNYEELLAKAVQYYKRATELDPNNLYAHFNLGVLFYNQSLYYYNMSQETIAEANKYKTQWEKPLPDAVKYLEAAHKIDPKDIAVLEALKRTYGHMGDNENYMRIKEEIKKVQSAQ